MVEFRNISGVIFDMDGVLYRGHHPMKGAADLLRFLESTGIPFVMATNNSSQTPQSYMQKLAEMDMESVRAEQIITSGTVSVEFLRENYEPETRVYVIGGQGFMHLVEEAGFILADHDVEAVVVGIDRQLTYDKLHVATTLILGGAKFIGTNPDVTFPTPDGLAPGAGSILALLQTATDVAPIVMGKPGMAMFHSALQHLGTRPAETLMIGDRLATDILGGQQAGLRTALLLTGVTDRAEAEDSDIVPDAIYENLCDLLADWRDALPQ